MDLIDRSKINFYKLTGPELKSAMEEAPSVPAVPLDKLCEWLGKQGMLAPCYFNQDCDECELKSYWRHKKSECWKQCLTKWMEEQEAQTDQPRK